MIKIKSISCVVFGGLIILSVLLSERAEAKTMTLPEDSLYRNLEIGHQSQNRVGVARESGVLNQHEVYDIIDSILDLPRIPVKLIEAINAYADAKYHKLAIQDSIAKNSTIHYPADRFYRSWDIYNTHPYNDELSKMDSTVELVLTDSVSGYVQPIIGLITSYFGDGRNHNGIDIDLEVWDTIVSAFDGIVRIARHHGGYGRVVVVRHYNGLETLYAHLHRIKVESGDTVKAGQLIGLGGSSGKSTGSHLHFECRFKGKPLNITNFADLKTHQLYNDTLILKRTRWSYSALPKGVKYHRVVKGEFLYFIAKKYGTSVSTICALNGISRNSILRVGQRLRIG